MILCQFSMLDPLGKERECSQYKYMYNMTECHQCELWLSTGKYMHMCTKFMPLYMFLNER